MGRRKRKGPQRKSGFAYGDRNKYVVDPETDCWEWRGATRAQGRYGVLKVNGRGVSAHVFFWEQRHGPVPEGMHLDHFLCENTLCVNPDHLRPEDPNVNYSRGAGKRWYGPDEVPPPPEFADDETDVPF